MPKVMLEGVRFSQRGCVSEIGGGPFQSEGVCFRLEGVFLFEQVHKKWRGCVSSGGGACIKWGCV